jgi:hypothetical protein
VQPETTSKRKKIIGPAKKQCNTSNMQEINSHADQVTHVVAHEPCGTVLAVMEDVHNAAGLNLALGELPGQIAGDLVQLDLPVAPRKEAGHVGPLSILAGVEKAFAVDLQDADVHVRTANQGISRGRADKNHIAKGELQQHLSMSSMAFLNPGTLPCFSK